MGVVSGKDLPRIPYGRQWIDDEDIARVVATLRSDFLTQGPEVAKFEAAIAEITGAKYVVAVANGTAALHLACLAAGVAEGDIGITSTNTFVASANAIRYAGGAVRFADVRPETGIVSVADVAAAIAAVRSTTPEKKLRVIVPVDFAGTVAPLGEIAALAKVEGAMVVEDASHSLGASYEFEGRTYRAAGCAHADMATLSFHPVKQATTGEGGAITTNDAALYKRLATLRTHGITKDPAELTKQDGPWYYEQQSLGFNYRITDMQCALGTSQLGKLPSFIARRREIARAYDAAFAGADFADKVTPLRQPDALSAYHLYVISVSADRRKALYMGLRERGIDPQVHYIPVHTQPDYVRAGFSMGNFPGAEKYYAGALSLPMFPRMTDADVERVVATVREVAGEL